MNDLNSETRRIYAGAFASFSAELTGDSLMAEAELATGLNDWGGRRWGEERFRHELHLLCSSIEAEAELSELGRTRGHSRLLTMLISRLRYLAYRSAHTGLDQQQIKRPLVGSGLPRAGTTFLHTLLGQDPSIRSPRHWEVALNVPPPEPKTYEDDVRAEIFDELLAFQGLDDPALSRLKPIYAVQPEECVFLHETAVGSMNAAYFRVPSFIRSRSPDMSYHYNWQIGVMQMLQSRFDNPRWSLKSASHLFSWNELLMAFPDACLYVNHRDPAKVVPSVANLHLLFRRVFSDDPGDLHKVAGQQMAVYARAVNAHVDWRQNNPDGPRVVDIHFSDLTARPLEAVAQIYDAFDMTLDATVIDRINRFVEIDHHGKKPARKYGLTEYGLTEKAIEDAFGKYIDYFNIKRENRG